MFVVYKLSIGRRGKIKEKRVKEFKTLEEANQFVRTLNLAEDGVSYTIVIE